MMLVLLSCRRSVVLRGLSSRGSVLRRRRSARLDVRLVTNVQMSHFFTGRLGTEAKSPK